MKKTLAIVLSCMLIIGVVCAMALTSSAEKAPAASVTVTVAGTATTLDATTKEVAGTTGKATFDAATGTLTLDGTTGIQKIAPAAGVLTVKVVGTNTVEGGTNTNILWSDGGDLVVTGTGTLNLSGKEYIFGANGNVTVDGPTMNIHATNWTVTHIGGVAKNGVMTFKGDSVVKITNAGGGPLIDVAGICPKLVITDNAKVTLNGSGTAIQVRISVAATEAFPKHSATAEISGKAQVVVEKGNQGLQLLSQYTDKDGKALTTAGFVPTLTIKDEASFTSKAGGQGIVVNADVAGADKAVLQILDKANVDIECIGSGQYQQGIDIRGGKSSVSSDVDITTTGTVKVKANTQGWQGAFYLRCGAGHDVFVKDANIIIDNPGGTYSQVVVAFYAQVKSNIVVAGNAKITASAKRDAVDANQTPLGNNGDTNTRTNRSFGFYLAAGSTCVFKDNAQLIASSNGDANKSWDHGASAIYLNASALTVQDNAVVNGTAGGIKIPAFSMEGACTVNVKGAASMNLKSTTFNALHYVSNTASVNVTENAVVNCDAAGASVGGSGTQNFAAKNALSEKTNVLASKVATVPANVASSDVTSSTAKITWDSIVNATGYKVYNGETLVATVATNEATVPVVPETAYSITVKSLNAVGVESAASAAVSFTTPKPDPSLVPPVAPTNVKVSGITATGATVTWDAVEGASSYDVFFGTDKVATVTETTATVANLKGGTEYKVTVKGNNGAGTGAASAEVAFTTLPENAVAAVTVILADGTEVVLNTENATALNGAVSFDVAKSELTLNNASGIQKITWTDGSLTLKVVGTNTVTSTELQNNIWGYGKDANLTVVGEGTLNVTGKAYVLGSQTGDLVIDGPTVNATSTNGTGVHVAADGLDSAIIVKGASKLNVTSKGYAMDAAGIAPSIIIKDTATVKIDSQNVGIAVRSNKAATDTITNKGALQILDKANVEVNSVGSGILMNAKVSDTVVAAYETTFTTEGKVTVNSKLSGWSAAGIYLTGSSAAQKQTFTVKNGTLEINITQTDGSEVACGIYTQKNVVVLFEDATINATVDCSSTVKTNRGQAIYFDLSEATFKGDTVVNSLNKGSAKDAGWHPSGASLHVHDSTLTIEGNAVVNAKADASVAKITAVALQTGKIIIKGNGKLNAESTNQAAIYNWDGKTNSMEVIENGSMSLKGTAGIRTTATFTLNKEAVLSGNYADKELTIVSPDYQENSGTSDVSYTAAITLLSVAVLAAAAVVVIRKKNYNV